MKDKEIFNARLLQMQIEMDWLRHKIKLMDMWNALDPSHVRYDMDQYEKVGLQMESLSRGIDNLINEHSETRSEREVILGISRDLGFLSSLQPDKKKALRSLLNRFVKIVTDDKMGEMSKGWVKTEGATKE
jgi:hypothetical protein